MILQDYTKYIYEKFSVEYYDPEYNDFPDSVQDGDYALAKVNNLGLTRGSELRGVILDNGEVIAAIFIDINGDVFSFTRVVEKTYRRKGLSKLLLDFALDEFEAVKEAIPNLYIEVESVNRITKDQLMKNNFELKNTFGGQDSKRWILRKDI